jgi:hypothetical protein
MLLIMTDIKELLSLVAQSPRADSDLAKAALERIVELEAYEARFEWIVDNCNVEGGGHGFTIFVPIDHEDIGCGIDAAIAAQSKEQG